MFCKLYISVFCVTAISLPITLSQDANYCRTPRRNNGVCVIIRDCDNLINLLRTQSNNPDVRNYLVRSTCGYQGNVPMVCCPQNKIVDEQQTITVPTTTTIVQEPTDTPPLTQPTAEDVNNITSSSLPMSPLCGRTTITNTRIVGGQNAQLGNFPWITALGYRNSKNTDQPKWLCGGSLISEKHVLTAGHCVYNRQDLYLARLGDLDLYSEDDGATPVNIPLALTKIHEEYNPTSYTNDIAILTLAYKVEHPKVWPVCLPLQDTERNKVLTDFSLYVAGWGSIYFNGPSSAILQKIMLPVWKQENCKDAFSQIKSAIIDDRVICAGVRFGVMDACQGDSGGPMMFAKQSKKMFTLYLIGVVSYGFKCAQPGYPGVYTRVTTFLDWIENNIN